jgi:F-type H+-transporting ATPase subunit b
MSIDWITVVAQIANFLLLVWLLKRFLYKPILNGIDAREAEIAHQMGEAERAKEKARAMETEFIDKKQALLSEESAMTKRAWGDIEKKRDQLMAEANATLEREQQEWRMHFDNERRKFTTELHQAGADTLYELTRKALNDLADEALEDQLVRHVCARLAPIAEDLREAAETGIHAVATTRDPLSDATCEKFKSDFNNLLPNIPLSFVNDPAQSPGLILRVGGALVDWTVDSYIDELNATLVERLATGFSGRADING